jgi:flagellar protein FlaG
MNVNTVGNAMHSLQKAAFDTQAAQPAAAVLGPAQQPAIAPPSESASSNEPQKKELKGSVDTINNFLKTYSNDLEFSIDEDSGRTVVKLVDTETDTVLRQYPSKQALAIARDIENFQGNLLKTEA